MSSANLKAIKPVLERAATTGFVREAKCEFAVEADMEGESAKELNRSFLSALRRVEKKTKLRAEWTSDDGTTRRLFDNVLKKTTNTHHPA